MLRLRNHHSTPKAALPDRSPTPAGLYPTDVSLHGYLQRKDIQLENPGNRL